MTSKSANSLADLLPIAHREPKPRSKGLNYIRSPAILGSTLDALLQCYAAEMDILKLSGHQATFAAESMIEHAIEACHAAGVRVSIGNPPLDMALNSGRDGLEKVLGKYAEWSVDLIEISVIARAIDDDDLAEVINMANAQDIEVIAEVGVDFAHTQSKDDELFLDRRCQQATRARDAGAKFVLLESEGLTENRHGEPMRWDAVDRFASQFSTAEIIFEADDQDVMCQLIEIYGPKSNMMVDYSRIEKIEAARRGSPPSQFLWGKVATIAPR